MCLGLRIFSENITLGALHVIQSTSSSIYWQITGLSNQIDSIVGSIFRISAFFAAQTWIAEKREGLGRTEVYRPKTPGEGQKRGMKIEVKGLSFRYPAGTVDVLKNVNLTVEAGETLAIVGVNGGGRHNLSRPIILKSYSHLSREDDIGKGPNRIIRLRG